MDLTMGPALVAAVVGLLLGIAYYYIGKMSGSGELEKKASMYFVGAITNILLVITLPFLIEFLSILLGVLGGIGDFDYYTSAYIAVKRIEATIRYLYMRLFALHLFISMLAGFSMHFNIPIPRGYSSVSLNFFGGFDILMNKLDDVLIQTLLTYGMLAARAVLLHLSPTLFLIFFPLGLMLRAFPWTKKTGSSMIALSLSLYLVYPASVLLSDFILFENGAMVLGNDAHTTLPFVMVEPVDEEAGDVFKSAIEKVENTSFGTQPPSSLFQIGMAFFKKLINVKNVLSLLYTFAGGVLSLFPHPGAKLFGYVLAGLGAAPFLEWVVKGSLDLVTIAFLQVFSISYTAAVILLGVFLSLLLEITITVSAFRAIGMMIGGETALLGLMRLV